RRRLNACASPDETSLRAGKTFADAAGAAAQPDPAPRPAAEQTPVLQTDRGMRARRLSRTGACDPRAPACDDQWASRGCCAAFQYIEEFFGEFPRKKTATEIVRRLSGRSHLILLANAPLPDDPGSIVPVSFKVAHEIRIPEAEPKLTDLVDRLRDSVHFTGRR